MNSDAGLLAAFLVAPFVMTLIGDAATGGAVSGAARGAFDHGRAQAASEGRRVKQAVVDNTKASWRKRLEDASATGPKSALWWGLAAARSARKVHRAVRRAGDRSVSLPAAGPFRRVFDATVAGAARGYRAARDEAKARPGRYPLRERIRQAGRHATAWARSPAGDDPAPTGVCDRCGVTCAAAALESDGLLKLCVLCRAPVVPGDTGIPESLPADAAEGDEAADGEIVPEPVMATVAAGPTRNGEIMAGQGHLARRTARAPAHRVPLPVVAGADITTHGDWDRLTQQVMEALELTARCKEAMLGRLTAADAGRTQIADIRNWADQAQRTVQFVRVMLNDTNARIYPLIGAVNAAGGPSEVASPGYHSDF